jgi:hypothetical protein
MCQEIRTALGGGIISMNIGIADMSNPQTWTLPTGLLSNFTQTRNLDFIKPTDVTPSSTTTDYFVGWVTKEGFRFYGRKASANPTPDPMTGEVSLSSLEISRFLPSPVLNFFGFCPWHIANEYTNAYATCRQVIFAICQHYLGLLSVKRFVIRNPHGTLCHISIDTTIRYGLF